MVFKFGILAKMGRSLLMTAVFVSVSRRVLATATSTAEFQCNKDKCDMEPGLFSIAYVTVPSMTVGKTIAHKLLENNLAACTNIIPTVTSIYRWKGEVEESEESLLMIKTRTSRVDELIKCVRDNHPYEVCEVVTVPIDNGNPPYMKWLAEEVPPKK